eukprot:CAMPEP_0119379954 /NCGR_PEP_ID=MMETSP1334-20130426/54873_1 /TAXON_ID=127549 /ORGANISM="Calcidiscus leptoporus, Strain RCC1130" /LENGTH=89 /DNA_ID=CAMNT_0007399611 /DNA_START=256 /DNA_END=522 /DNA_ORIENTATION=+
MGLELHSPQLQYTSRPGLDFSIPESADADRCEQQARSQEDAGTRTPPRCRQLRASMALAPDMTDGAKRRARRPPPSSTVAHQTQPQRAS